MEKSNIQPWKTLSSSTALDERWFTVRRDTVQLPLGKVVDDYFVWESPHIAMVVPMTSEGDLVIVRQYRHAVGQILHQFPAGAVDKDETVEAAARREMREESGYQTTERLQHLGTIAPYSTKITGVTDIYLAPNATQTSTPEYDEQEETEVLTMSPENVLELCTNGELQQADFISAAYLALNALIKRAYS